ncbi:MAG: CHASE2 domain-containing protein [Gammaproteobacteria bacterium]|nr:CHASE2 domain-containing protein [Gammaproteobacteria bacterium]
MRSALHSLLLAAVALFFLNLNIVGTASPSKRFSQDLVYAWFGDEAWLYPRVARGMERSPASASRVVVMIIDEPALALRAVRWPVPLAFHAQLLGELAVLRPRGVLLDFLLIDPAPRRDVCDLLSVAERLHRAGIPLYLAVTRPDDLAPMDAADCRDAAGAPLRVAQVLTPVAVQRQVDGSDFVSRRYPFEQRLPNVAAGSGLASAAVRMYCDTERVPAACVARLARGETPDAGFELAWSPEGDPFNQRWSHTSCKQTTSPVSAVLNEPALPRESPCPPIATLFAGALLSPEEDAALGPGNEDLFGLTGGSFLMVGGNFRGSGDLVTTPMHTLLPGVYYHAVALENLLAFDGHPKVRKEFRNPKLLFYSYDLLVLWILAAIYQWRQRSVQHLQAAQRSPFMLSDAARSWLAPVIARCPTPLWMLGAVAMLLLLAAFKSLQLIAVAATIVLLVAVEMRVAPATEQRDRLKGLLLYIGAMVLSLAVIVLAVWVGYRWLRLPPGDWLGYFSFAAFGFFVAHATILEFGRRVDELYVARKSHGGAR